MSLHPAPDPLQVSADEAQAMRLFALEENSRPEAQLIEAASQGNAALTEIAGQLLGNQLLDPAWIELIDRKDVEPMGGLEAYLKAGYDPPEEALAALRPALATAPKRMLLVLSRAFGGQAASLAPRIGLTPLAAVSLIHTPEAASPMMADEPAPGPAEPPSAPVKPRKSDARVSGMIAMAALLAAGALTMLMVWIGG
ncbi:MAG: hypothetical protein OIF40_00450 [Mangrovicoccus sp.]|nr:hypothetical protein [Mangrovicoccus sp.]